MLQGKAKKDFEEWFSNNPEFWVLSENKNSWYNLPFILKVNAVQAFFDAKNIYIDVFAFHSKGKLSHYGCSLNGLEYAFIGNTRIKCWEYIIESACRIYENVVC